MNSLTDNYGEYFEFSKEDIDGLIVHKSGYEVKFKTGFSTFVDYDTFLELLGLYNSYHKEDVLTGD